MIMKVTRRQSHQFLSEYLYTAACESTFHDGGRGRGGGG